MEMAHDLLIKMPEILDHISDVVVIFDPEAHVLWLNKGICEAMKFTRSEIIGKTQKQLVEEGYIRGSVVYAAIRERKEVSGIVYAKDGTEVMTRCKPIFDDKDNLLFVVGTSTNIQELNALRVNLEKERRQNKKYKREIEHLRKMLLLDKDNIFDSTEMKTLLEVLLKVAPFDYTVLITGESGVGKEVVAKTIHLNSSRRNESFTPVSIPAIPANLLESELFGYEGGTFTGSLREGKMGLFEVAHGGTLFLDEVGDIPQDIQVKILRAIESNEIRRIGSTQTIKLDVRIIAATNRPLDQMIKKGLFREDLYYRLSVVPIHIKPLRERMEDIYPLCHHFLDEINKKYNLNKTISKDAMDIMKQHQWPGNVRELKHVVERLSVLSNGDLIIPEDVMNVLSVTNTEQSDHQPTNAIAPLKDFESFEKLKILDALKHAGGNKKKAAAMLGMTRTKFYRRLAKYS
ncbi:MAG: sigma 54-interacting transcriptional regulator [Syntrophaceae bacterium]|nr:sigma 54-interacting transcriptional regulator [Syntrophaceae bacterium]